LFTYSAILTLAPAVRERSWNVDYRWAHWFGFLVWALTFTFIRRELAKRIPDTDPYLLSACGLLCGWGLLTIWRLDPMFGLRQTIWLAACGTGFIYATRRAGELQVLRSQKYILLGAGLALTALTLVLGTNPGGPGPRLWLGCCGVYFQPSEPLKLLLVTYLAAYLADHLPVRVGAFPVLLHTAFVVSLALALLLVQRDLGTASLVILLYAAVLYLATDRARVLAAAALGLFAALWFGYASIEVIHSRLQSWIDPWQDPAGTSYQIVQSLLAIANGGAIGRGPGIGNPGLVPVAISDFVYAALAEETGLAGSVALAALVAVILVRGLTAALNAPDDFRRLLAGAATAYLGMQSLLILGGNLRALPLTGVTLPFMSYGGSSLVTSFSALFLLLSIGANREYNPGPLETSRPYSVFGGLLLLGLALLALTSTWWALLRGPDLLTRTDNARRSIADRTVPRGRLLDRGGLEINRNAGQAGSYGREYLYPELTPVIGYTHTVFGQSGLEASLDEFLRGTRGQPVSRILWERWYTARLLAGSTFASASISTFSARPMPCSESTKGQLS
jgi:cell division protein FtsW (lipid II flippase)